MRHKRLKLPHPHRQSVKFDRVSASDFLHLNLIFCCEQCSHFNGETKKCSIEFEAGPHLREKNLENYEVSGQLAYCRHAEID